MAATLRPCIPPLSALFFNRSNFAPPTGQTDDSERNLDHLLWQAAAPCFDGAADLPMEREQKADEWWQLELVVVWVNIILQFFCGLIQVLVATGDDPHSNHIFLDLF